MNKLYIIVRADLEPGLQAAQACHALRQFVHYCPEDDHDWFYGEDFKRPQEPHGPNNIVILQVPNEHTLKKLVVQASASYVSCASFQEPDLDNQTTAVALYGEGVEKLVSNLPLALRAKREAA